jgi:hypothetical protein
MVLSLTCMTALAMLMYCFNHQPSTSWNFYISINATVALLSTTAKATLLTAVAACLSQAKWLHFQKQPRLLEDLDTFDEASRGPTGSL